MIDVNLTGQTALVTGSAGGLGREIVLALAERGADVAVQYQSSADAAQHVVAAATDYDVAAMAIQADITDETAVRDCCDKIEAELGGIDILINNVGDFAPEHWEEMDPATWKRVMETNLFSTYLCSRRVLPGMRSRNYGRIVNIGYADSDKGLVNPVNFPYFVAKTGVLMFTRMLAADTRDDNITVNAVSPYVIENSDRFPDTLPQGRAATFGDVIAPILFFLDPNVEYVSGENVSVDGGWLPESV